MEQRISLAGKSVIVQKGNILLQQVGTSKKRNCNFSPFVQTEKMPNIRNKGGARTFRYVEVLPAGFVQSLGLVFR